MKALKMASLSLIGLVILLWLVLFISVRFESHDYHKLTQAQKSDAKVYFEKTFEPLPTTWQWRSFESEPGVELRTGFIEHPNAKGTVVIVPGFTSPIEMNARAIEVFHAAGYKVAAIDYRGQGGSWRPLSNPEKGYVEDYVILADDLTRYAQQVRVSGQPLFIFAISKGAHITMRSAENNLADVSAYALAVPMIEILAPGDNMSALKFLANTVTNLGLGTAYPPGLSIWPPADLVFGKATSCNANPETAQIQDSLFAHKEHLRVRGVTMRWLKETIDSTKYLMSKSASKKISQPVRIFNAGDDRIVNANSAKRFCDSLSDCVLTEFAEARHCINRENYQVYDEILQQSIELFEQAASGP